MMNVILVLNAGSSSIKFCLFAAREGSPEILCRGQVEGLSTSPRFIAKAVDGAIMAEKAWGEGVKLGHEEAIEHWRERRAHS